MGEAGDGRQRHDVRLWSSALPEPVVVKAMKAISSEVMVKKGRSGMRTAAS